jgi:hypothetical protein
LNTRLCLWSCKYNNLVLENLNLVNLSLLVSRVGRHGQIEIVR